MSVRSRFRALLALATLIVGVVGLPVVLVVIDAIPSADTLSWSRLSAPDDGTLTVGLITMTSWGAWAVFTAAVLLDVASRLRGLPTPRLPGMALPQLTAGQLVAVASLLFVATPAVTSAVSINHADAAPPEAPTQALEPTSFEPDSGTIQPSRTASPGHGTAAARTSRYLVKRGDSLWKIAEAHLGDGKRYGEIVELNDQLLRGRPDFLFPGTELHLPADDADDRSVDDHVVVRAGDTLSHIAAEHLGDADRYPEILRHSRSIEQPDGSRIEDPDLIRPGWRLALPGTTDDSTIEEPAPGPAPAPPQTGPTPSPPSTDAGDLTAAPEPGPDETKDDSDGSSQPSWVVPGLAGAGAGLAGAMLLVLRQHRRTQARFRHPGQVIAPPPRELRGVEKTAQLTGSVTAPRINLLDRALRALVSGLGRRPAMEYVALGQDHVRLHFSEPLRDLPAPWSGSGTDWSAALDHVPAADPEQIAPYPMLVSLGRAANGDLVLVDLENLGAIRLTGESDRASDLARHLAAELALNPWAELVEVDTLGIAAELAEIDPVRMRHHDDTDTRFLDRLASSLHAESPSEPDRFRAVVARAASDPGLAHAVRVITARTGRTGAAVVHLTDVGHPAKVIFELTSDGRVTGGPLGDDVAAAGLSPQEATACAAIVDLTRDAQSVAPPASTHNDATDSGGAIRPDLTTPRPKGHAGSGSLLPGSSAEYVVSAATTEDDVTLLAPVVPPTTANAVKAADLTLDDDLVTWFDNDALVPRLHLLGPVGARAFGNPRAVAKRKPFYVELLSYLVLHPDGTTSAEVADAFGLTTSRTRVDIAVLRSWLGDDPRTGDPYLPSANAIRASSGHGSRRYQVDGVLTDLDLFRRLRTRGQARGEEGIGDLRTALSLVSGEPFSHLRPAGWSWLLDGDRTDHIMTCAVADVSHLVVTRALSEDDVGLARWAAEIGHCAAPSDETCRLDLIQVAAASGHADLAVQQLASEVLNRRDDGLGPTELPGRTVELMRTRNQTSRSGRT